MIMHAIKSSENTNDVRKYFKKIALLVHPDKNSHPLANDVFKKFSDALRVTDELVSAKDYAMQRYQ